MIHQDDIKWKMKSSLSLSTKHHNLSRDNELGVQWEQISTKGPMGQGIKATKNFFFIDNDAREFLTVESLVDAYNEKFQFEDENPEQEVIYVKVIRKRKP